MQAAAIERARHRARDLARLLGAEGGDQEDRVWVVSELFHRRFGEEVDDGIVVNGGRCSVRGNRALLEENGEVVVLELVPKAELDKWKKERGGGGDLRLLGLFRGADGKRQLGFSDAVRLMSYTKFEDTPHEGPAVLLEFMQSVTASSGSLTSYHHEWLRLSGVGENTAIAHNHRTLLEALRLGAVYDQLNLPNSAMAEQIARRIVQDELAVERNPRHPDYGGLETVLGGPVGEKGKASTPSFSKWLSDRQHSEAHIMKQARLLREERGSEERRQKTKEKPKKGAKGGSGDAVKEE